MNLFQVVKSLQTIALSNPYIRNVGDGSIYDFMNANPSIRYGVFFVSQTSHREDDIFDWYGFNLFVIDRLVDNLESNRLQIQSVAKDVLSNTIKTFINKFLGITHEEIFYTPFTERFSDLCAGQYCNVEFRIPKAIICEEDFEDIIPIHPDCPDMDDVYESGKTDGINYQKSLLTTTAITENGTYTRENGFNEVEVNIEGCNLQPLNVTYMRNGRFEMTADPGYDGFQSPFAITVDVPEREVHLEPFDKIITANGTYEYQVHSGYDGFQSPATFFVNVPQSGHTDEEMREQFQSGYTSGYTDGFESGHTSGRTDGINYQKSLLTSTAITENGTYTRENGFSAITVNVPQSGYTQEDLDAAYQRGFNDGVSSVDCTPAYESGYTSGYTDGYESGYTDGVNSSGETDYSKLMFAIQALENTVVKCGSDGYENIYYDYKINGGEWHSGHTYTFVGDEVNLSTGDIVSFKDIRGTGGRLIPQTKWYFTSTGRINVYGNVMSLIDSQTYLTNRVVNQPLQLFKECTTLVSAKNLALPATTLYNPQTSGDGCYQYMFSGCVSLVEAPTILPATTLAEDCYMGMFEGCTSLTTAPALPATTLTKGCYWSMFKGCTNLNYIKCLATDISAYLCTSYWVNGVSSTGTFVKNPNMAEWTRGNNGIPSSWTVVEE